MEDIRLEGQAGRLAAVMTAVVVNGQKGKEYRLPTEHELISVAEATEEQLQDAVCSTFRLGCRRNRLPSKDAPGIWCFRSMASTRGASCSRIGSYWLLLAH